MKRLGIFIIFLIIISQISACEDGQIDINSATKEELDNLYGIGPAKAEAIINSRPFDSVDDLTKVNGIGEATLKDIKEQGLACVSEKEDSDKESEEISHEEKSEEVVQEEQKENATEEKDSIETIKLNTKIIKSEENKEDLGNADYVKYGFAIFCALLGVLIVLKRKKYKTEFN